MSLDLAARAEDVRRLAWRHPAFIRAVEAGKDPDDLLQDVYLRLLTRQQGASAFDPERASFSRYVWVVIHSAIRNYTRDHKRPPTVDLYDDDGAADSLVHSDRVLVMAAPEPVRQERLVVTVARVARELELDAWDRCILYELAEQRGRRRIRERYGLPLRARPGELERVRRVLRRVREYLEARTRHHGATAEGARTCAGCGSIGVCDLDLEVPGGYAAHPRARAAAKKNASEPASRGRSRRAS